jgi:hypothetical protein
MRKLLVALLALGVVGALSAGCGPGAEPSNDKPVGDITPEGGSGPKAEAGGMQQAPAPATGPS